MNFKNHFKNYLSLGQKKYGNIGYGMCLYFLILYLISFLWDANSERLYTFRVHLLMRYIYSLIFCITFLNI